MGEMKITTVEMHTGGEPLRIIKSGYPTICGDTILQKRSFAKSNLDHLRKSLMLEPRGHEGMYGAIPVDTDIDKADVAFLFIHGEGYSTMCGHAIIALGRYCIDENIVQYKEPETQVNIQCPCGMVPAFVKCNNGKTSSVRFHSVPSFALELDFDCTTQYGSLKVDIAYGGAFYGILPLALVGLNWNSPIKQITEAATNIKKCLMQQTKCVHPFSDELSHLYGIIFTDNSNEITSDSEHFNLTIFANAQVDRSPCGSGSTARMAALFAKNMISISQEVSFKNPVTQSCFRTKVVQTAKLSNHDAVVIEVSGNAHYCGTATFTQEKDDVLSSGFLL